MAEFIELEGHKVDPTKIDRFYHGDGRRVSDEEWDEDKRRAIAGLAGEVIVPLDVRDEPPNESTDEAFVWEGDDDARRLE